MWATVCTFATRSRQVPVCVRRHSLEAVLRPRSKLQAARYSTARTPRYLSQEILEGSRHDSALILHSTSSNPYINLALEHYLLTTTDPGSRILLFYTNRPCVVIGRNQNPWIECNLKLLQDFPLGPVHVVRRRSGGGTVFHDEGNLNFSVIVPNDKAFTRRKHAEMVTRALRCSELEPFAQYKLFEDVWVNDRHDITMARNSKQFKVSGSAFKLTRGRALHHGTLLHSSPNLDKISAFLRSPGKSFIQAKGAESVRSPVSNLYNISSLRNELKTAMTRAIVKEFKLLYESLTQEIHVEDQYCLGQYEILKGAQELMTDDWTYGQTPRFEFSSDILDDRQVCMSVNHGVIESASFKHQALPALHMITDWKATLDGEGLGERLVKQVEDIFPVVTSAHDPKS